MLQVVIQFVINYSIFRTKCYSSTFHDDSMFLEESGLNPIGWGSLSPALLPLAPLVMILETQ